MEYTLKTETEFAKDVLAGLSAPQKYLSSKYFYDQRGDKLFQQIMRLPEYYLTKKEFAILDRYKAAILAPSISSRFNLVEMGAGDGLKTKILINHLQQEGADFTYFPIDISSTVLDELKADLQQSFTSLDVEPIVGTYKRALEQRKWENDHPTLLLFLGGNIGNFHYEQAVGMLRNVAESLKSGDHLLIGFDLKKDPDIILRAYNDAEGVTRDFNLNILARINKELGGDFDLTKFKHWPMYDPVTGECRSYLVSTQSQKICVKGLERDFYFEKAEPIHTEVSKKYSHHELEKLAAKSGFLVVQDFEDQDHYFTNSLWQKQ
ncbi:L-histidine N(alpha)-methyltransferase [Echinicola rosea]|uniref:Dimethylhistidine N-methyltransferase n=1 Tax=Echinicola rosea TaxID=1807691 RepID=A0ABQ1VAK9_9BACT|nr:L-histidine N(alpha)-methyltransferase [Echinicola rosea]GGF44938.1 dimethylhistidine N-methyltransferase [Echinicola rosea]